MNQVVCVGELLIDWFPQQAGLSLREAELLARKPGGAPANVATVIAALGGQSVLVASVGADPFGDFLREVVAAYGVDVSLVRGLRGVSTAMAFVARLEDGGRDFVFVHGADHCWEWDEDILRFVEAAAIVHFGAATLQVDDSVRIAYTDTLRAVAATGGCVSFDPNFRADLWKGREGEWTAWVRSVLGYCDLVKMSDEELCLFTGAADLQSALRVVATEHMAWQKLTLLITCGAEGAYVLLPDTRTGDIDIAGDEDTPSVSLSRMLHIPIPLAKETVDEAPIVDTTGAGDAFVGATLQALSMREDWKRALSDEQEMRAIVDRANRVAGWICRQMGAMPDLGNVNFFVK